MTRIAGLQRATPKALLLPLLLVVCAASPAASVDLPALNTPPSNEHHVGKVVWADLVTPDLAAAEKFYGALFGWTFSNVAAGSGATPGNSGYAVAMLDGRPIAGLLQRPIPSGEHRQPAWLTFIAVRDVDVVKRVALSKRAKLLSDSHSYPERGRQCVLADPEGAVFALLASSSGDAPDYLAAPGEWIWSSLHAKDAGAEAAFYQQLFGYDVYEAGSDDGLVHLILSSDDYARASANDLESGSMHRHSHWLNFVRVASAADVAAKATELGGRVLVEPRVDRHGGMLAVLADPAGAPFGVMEWSDSDSKAEPQ